MLKTNKSSLIGQLLLLLATMAWGTSFVVLKDTIDELPPMFVVGVRFLASGIIFGLIFIKRTIKMNKGVILRGIAVGACVFFAYLTQTYGLKLGTPSRNAFITSLYCVMTPFFVWLFFKVKPKSYNVIAALLCVVGIGFIALSGDNGEKGLLIGDILTFLGAIGFAMQIIFLENSAKKQDDGIQLLTMELFSCGVMLMLFSLAVELPSLGISAFKMNGEQALKILYMTLVCTLFAQFAQLFGQRAVAPSRAAIILSLEAVFGTIFSIIMKVESLTTMLIIGFVIIFIGTLISELKIDVLKPFNKTKEKEAKQEDL